MSLRRMGTLARPLFYILDRTEPKPDRQECPSYTLQCDGQVEKLPHVQSKYTNSFRLRTIRQNWLSA